MSGTVARRPGFEVRVSTVFIVLAILGLAIPIGMGWGAHDGGMPGILAFVVFPWSAIIAVIAALVYLAKGRSVQSWLETAVAVGLAGFAALSLL